MKKSEPTPNPTRWVNSLPSTYQTLNTGFHAGMTVEEMVAHLKMDVAIPEKIKKIKIGSFSPNIYLDDYCEDFWRTPIDRENLSPQLRHALDDPSDTNDEHYLNLKTIQNLLDGEKEVNGKKKEFTFDPENPDLMTIARLAQAQYIGFQVRMGELTTQKIFERLEKFNQPAEYKKLLNHPFVKKNNLQGILPKTPPTFALERKTSVKTMESGLRKSYQSTGKPKDAAAFFNNPDVFGVFAITDLQRTRLQPQPGKSGQADRERFLQDYMNLRNVLTVILLTGEIGVVVDTTNEHHHEISEKVLYPGGNKPSDQYPVYKANGESLCAGPKGSHLKMPFEIQIAALPQHIIDQTHDLYKVENSIEGDGEEEKKARDDLRAIRIDMFNKSLPPNVIKIRQTFLENMKTIKEIEQELAIGKDIKQNTKNLAQTKENLYADDPLMGLLRNGKQITNPLSILKRAIDVAYSEAPERESVWAKSVVEFDPFTGDRNSAIIKQALKDMVRPMKEDTLAIPLTVVPKHGGLKAVQ